MNSNKAMKLEGLAQLEKLALNSFEASTRLFLENMRFIATERARSLAEAGTTSGRHEASTFIDAGSSPAVRANPAPDAAQSSMVVGLKEGFVGIPFSMQPKTRGTADGNPDTRSET